jgi:O-antigen/teichoic acid export membrane protein
MSGSEAGARPQGDVLDSAEAGGKAIRGGAVRTAAFFVAMLMSLVSVPFMTRHLGPEAFGYYATAFSILFILGGVTEAGLTNLGTRDYVTLEGRERERFLRNLVGLRLSLTVGGIGLAIALTAATGAATEIVAGVAIAGAGMVLSLTQQTYAVVLNSQLRLGWVSALELLRQGTLTAGILVLVVAGASLLPFFAASVLAGAVVLVATVALLRGQAPLLPLADVGAWRATLKRVLPYALAAAVGLIYFRLAIILMSYVAPEREVGLYGGAFRIVETVGVVPWLLVSSAFPILARAARDDAGRLRYAVGRLFDVSVLLGVWSALALAMGAGFAVQVVLGGQFNDAVPVLQLQALALLGSFFVATGLYTMLSLERFRALLVASALAAVTSGALTLVLVPELGAEGAALATAAAELVLAIGVVVAIRDVVRPGLGTLARALPGIAGMAGVGLLVDAHDVVVVLLGSAVFWAAALACRAVPPELLAAVRRRDPGSV